MCGPEIGVASTKAYTSQIIAITLMALKVGEDRVSTQERREQIIQGLKDLPALVTKTLGTSKTVLDIATSIKEKKSLLVMGRGYHYGTALEGALKIKEISYVHCEGVLSGELKVSYITTYISIIQAYTYIVSLCIDLVRLQALTRHVAWTSCSC